MSGAVPSSTETLYLLKVSLVVILFPPLLRSSPAAISALLQGYALTPSVANAATQCHPLCTYMVVKATALGSVRKYH